MPNTLAHVGVQSLATHIGVRGADPKWIYLGCVIPDLPWILQRVVHAATSGVDPYSLRAYVIVQSSLFGSLILCAAVALVATSFWRVFGILGLNVVFHLLLDACQMKWANGVHFLAPFSWDLTNWGFFWPENILTYFLTGLGLVAVVWQWRGSIEHKLEFSPLSMPRVMGSVLLVTGYFLLPFLFLDGPREANNHYLKTLNASQDRVGQYVELDRARYVTTPDAQYLSYYGGAERVPVEPLELHSLATVSVRGIFVEDHKLRVIETHLHPEGLRDYASYLGLGLIVVIWAVAWRRETQALIAKR